jgi:S-adenosyl-L-methionine hydrolase (adenosine-forming)
VVVDPGNPGRGKATVAAGILTLTTDFGGDGPYVASIKGVVLGLAPGTQIVDVSHAIAPQEIAEGSFVLAEIVDSFPEGTVHLAVVDPGVGTERRLIAVEARGQWFVVPDNGLIGGVLRGKGPSGAWEIRNPELRRSVVSPTFHGRDILAPAAAHLLRGRDPSELGPPVTDLVLPSAPEPIEDEDGLTGEVVFLDSFGNLITNIPRDRIGSVPSSAWTVEILGRTIDGLVRTYGERPPGTVVALIGSSDRVEVAVVNGDAARNLRARPGTPVQLRRKREPIA